MKKKINIVLFKKDLRITDHKPMTIASQSKNYILPLYVIEPDYWKLPFSSRRHWYFLRDCLVDLREKTSLLGQPLVIRVGNVVNILDELSHYYYVEALLMHEETSDLWSYDRDKKINNWVKKNSVPIFQFPNNGVVRGLKNRDDWLKVRDKRIRANEEPYPRKIKRLECIDCGVIPDKDSPIFGSAIKGKIQKGGRNIAEQIIKSFIETRYQKYMAKISSPLESEFYCSRLSPHLTWGTISVREVDKILTKKRFEVQNTEEKKFNRNLSAFKSRLYWRCHFIQKLEDLPSIQQDCIHPFFEELPSKKNKKNFTAWKTGFTGFPFVDACIRRLTYEGWINFRMRAMLVSFARYNLGIDWRLIANHLAKLFTDFEPGIHFSQVQMQSGLTGINTIRIYNPIKQSYDQDPHGFFIKKWVPELKEVGEKWIHEPWNLPEEIQRKIDFKIGKNYPTKIVDEFKTAKEARNQITVIRRKKGFLDIKRMVYEKLGSRKETKKSFIKTTRVKDKTKKKQMSLFD